MVIRIADGAEDDCCTNDDHDRPLVPTGDGLPLFVSSERSPGALFIELPIDPSRGARVSDLRQAAISAGMSEAEHLSLSFGGKELDDEQDLLSDVGLCARSWVYFGSDSRKPRNVREYESTHAVCQNEVVDG